MTTSAGSPSPEPSYQKPHAFYHKLPHPGLFAGRRAGLFRLHEASQHVKIEAGKRFQFIPLCGRHVVLPRVMLTPNVNRLTPDYDTVQLTNNAQNRREIIYAPLHEV